ncbi:MAG: hypothetical protein FWH01_03060 [Oscillospiraceae bacterium]|nr:hypothetical protein [Oscillospiraceae bacterium]
MNIIPDKPGKTPSYFCTWSSQYASIAEERKRNPLKFIGNKAAEYARSSLNDETVFGVSGMAEQHKKIQSDLYFVLDDGWDVPYGVHESTHKPEFGSLLLDEERFPSCAGAPTERLRKMDERLKSFGWRGAGLWVAAQARGESEGNVLDAKQAEVYWSERIGWCREAGINYWKVDWGLHCISVDFRRMLCRLGRQGHPGLLIEQCRCMRPTNQDADGRFAGWEPVAGECRDIFSFSDIFRSYDVTRPFSVVSTLDRIAFLLQSHVDIEAAGMINSEDELYLGAALGCTLGIMRSGYGVATPAKPLDEAVRAVRWQRIAPAFGAKETPVQVSDELLRESWFFEAGATWALELQDKEVTQSGPSVISRGMPLPHISNYTDRPPFIVAAKNPNGAVSIATLRRTYPDRYETPICAVELDVGQGSQPIGIFGHYGQLTLEFDDSVAEKTVYAQDMAGDTAFDITSSVKRDGKRLVIPGKLIDQAGTSCASPNDKSEPGLVIALG